MKKIILLMLLAFSSTTLVYADEFDDKIEAYKNVFRQHIDSILEQSPDNEMLKQQSDILFNEISNIYLGAFRNFLNKYGNERTHQNAQYATDKQIFNNLKNRFNELRIWKITKARNLLRLIGNPIIQEEIKIKDVILDKDVLAKTALSRTFSTEIRKNLVGFQDPYMYSYAMPKNLMQLFFAGSTILLCKNDQPFPLMHSPHGAIQHEGLGRYDVYTNGNVYFSTPDNSDPRHDANKYFLVPAQTEIDLKCLQNDACAKVLAPAQNPLIHIIKKEKIVHQMGNMFAYKIPDSLWNRLDHNDLFSLILVEDGIPLTTISTSHHYIVENGGGLYNVFENQYLYFSTTDTVNFNPMNNEKNYVLVITEPR